MNKRILASTLAAVTIAASQMAMAARDHISIVGSSTVYPFTTTVAERFSRATKFKTPVVESTGTGGGMKLFCQGVGENTADITGASRRIKQSELDMCHSNGVEVVEIQIGFDGIVLANAKSAASFKLSRKEIFLALAKEVPNPDGSETLVPNPYKTWKDVNPALPNTRIEVLGPPPTSGTRDAFAELGLEGGCKSFAWIAAKKKTDKNTYKAICHTVREDGAYIEAGENDNLIVNKLVANPDALGVFGFSFLDQNSDKVQGTVIEGKAPTFESIADQSYPISRPLFIYVKKAHADVIPGIKPFLAEFTSERAWGEDGYLADKGMISLPTAKRRQVAADVRELNVLTDLSEN
ncbi:PstS family phosphate ABC transporter substrate-binding protein [Microbulbifer thermotolerans]|uniref:Phosphate ABC transporter substrate-binding protein n=1 Tax=Microbulbifer thermotolerans TaxID=252514 RepID=A0A143HQ95_MICTH|nr:PstS family phosphate ABC transporter substrate-binding protein [Microbulbifer thermotolerans]AMX03893.1 phosphate ABC transporter substrate-binding protein [Microbulbifer thermotolerans]MCX2778588.1 PstS family phosphate ABC transporter substrate-binding protein [Microbulbifer thermotolerans]MCX2794064.1 PstS family phosphate ABC transporter substrate-binding protein [Microbulbifer thermotolerans]MCX2802959.1 PstS family phosphate ABC transporter substrate-binding protein [Microbulbifer the